MFIHGGEENKGCTRVSAATRKRKLQPDTDSDCWFTRGHFQDSGLYYILYVPQKHRFGDRLILKIAKTIVKTS